MSDPENSGSGPRRKTPRYVQALDADRAYARAAAGGPPSTPARETMLDTLRALQAERRAS